VQLVEESILLSGGGSAMVTRSLRTVIAGGPASYQTSSQQYSYHLDMLGRITMQFCPPVDDCELNRSGLVSREQLELFEPSDPTYAWVYDRADIHIDTPAL
jgi:hypothetical protein